MSSRLSSRSLRRATLSSWTTSGGRKGHAVRAAIRAAKAKLFFLPAYSPDLNPIEQAFAKMKTLLRKADARTIEQTWRTLRRPARLLHADRMHKLLQERRLCFDLDQNRALASPLIVEMTAVFLPVEPNALILVTSVASPRSRMACRFRGCPRRRPLRFQECADDLVAGARIDVVGPSSTKRFTSPPSGLIRYLIAGMALLSGTELP